MNEIKIFENEEFGEIRVVLKNSLPYFNLKDVCNILGIGNTSDVKKRLLKDGVDSIEVIDSIGRKQKATFIDESNLYKCIFQSRKSEAEKFTLWVTKEVLPSIRKTGFYGISEEDKLLLDIIGSEDKVSRALVLNEYQNKFVIPLKENAEYTTNVLKSESLLTVSQIAKDLGMSAIRLNKLLESLDIQYKKGGKWYIKAKYQDKGYAQYETVLVSENKTVHNLKWTEKGKKFIIEKLDKEYGIKLNTLRKGE